MAATFSLCKCLHVEPTEWACHPRMLVTTKQDQLYISFLAFCYCWLFSQCYNDLFPLVPVVKHKTGFKKKKILHPNCTNKCKKVTDNIDNKQQNMLINRAWCTRWRQDFYMAKEAIWITNKLLWYCLQESQRNNLGILHTRKKEKRTASVIQQSGYLLQEMT